MQEELRRQEDARRSFVATASHELRTPLTMLQGTMELLEEDLRDGRVDIEDAQLPGDQRAPRAAAAVGLAGELLDLSRLDAAVPLRSEPVELGELARAVAAEFEPARAASATSTLEVIRPPDGLLGPRRPRRGRARGADPARQRAALRPGGPAGDARARTSDRGAPAIEVADRGPGIPEEEREHIFERFQRGRTAGAESGFGLGLAIGRELAERMGGTLRARRGRRAGRVLRAHARVGRARGRRRPVSGPRDAVARRGRRDRSVAEQQRRQS